MKAIWFTFSNKSNRFKRDTVFYPPESDPLAAQWLAEDNGVRLERTLNYDSITEKAEALRMAEVAAKVSRDSGTCSFTAFPIAAKLQPGDIIGVTDETRGWIEKPFRATELADATHDVELRASGNTVVHIDAAHRGVGTASCGPDTLPQYLVSGGTFSFTWSVRAI